MGKYLLAKRIDERKYAKRLMNYETHYALSFIQMMKVTESPT